jgi:hypothetical protein
LPIFSDKQFERFFCVTLTIAQQLLYACANSSVLFVDGYDATKRKSICPKVKILMCLKCLAYGVSPSAFQDYFQMGESTGLLYLKTFCCIVCHDCTFRDVFFRQMNRSDALRITELHRYQHGINGMIGSLDCMHVAWKNCPMAWQGQFKGKEKSPTIVVEAFADYNLWIWHDAFGYAGTLNDINIWEQSPLLRTLLY